MDQTDYRIKGFDISVIDDGGKLFAIYRAGGTMYRAVASEFGIQIFEGSPDKGIESCVLPGYATIKLRTAIAMAFDTYWLSQP